MNALLLISLRSGDNVSGASVYGFLALGQLFLGLDFSQKNIL